MNIITGEVEIAAAVASLNNGFSLRDFTSLVENGIELVEDIFGILIELLEDIFGILIELEEDIFGILIQLLEDILMVLDCFDEDDGIKASFGIETLSGLSMEDTGVANIISKFCRCEAGNCHPG